MIHLKNIATIYMPAYLAILLCSGGQLEQRFQHWLTASLHGTLIMIVAWEGHWILLLLHCQGSTLHLDVWDNKEDWTHFPAHAIACRLRRALALPTCVVTRHGLLDQEFPYTCGTICLLHLGLILQHWTPSSLPDELELHMHLLLLFDPRAGLRAGGKGDSKGSTEERDVLWQLRDILHAHGVPHVFTEERAQLGITCLGLQDVATALNSRNPWAALKSLGSQPRNIYMWIKPTELDAQIRKKARTQFKIQPSSKRTASKAFVQGNMVDPTDLKLIENLFVDDSGNPAKQLAFAEVQAAQA